MLVTMNEILKDAQKNRYAVGLFNTIDSNMIEAAIRAAEELRSPILIGTAEVLLPYGDLPLIGPAMISMAKRASVPVAVHYDHGLTVERCKEAIEIGFSSIMFDGSANEESETLRVTREMVEYAHARGVSVEGEIGHVGTVVNGDGENADLYTTPEQAIHFVEQTGVDALAIAIGTAHGAYKSAPKLDIGRLKEIRAALDTPLVLHGGSGLSDEDFRRTIEGGITKVNIFTDPCVAAVRAMHDYAHTGDIHLVTEKKVAYAKAAIMEKIRLFGSAGRA